MNNLMKRFAQTVAVAGGTLMASAMAAQADCSIKDNDTGKRYSRVFEGQSPQNIWERYCKKFLQNNIAKEGIRNGEFSMRCWGSVRCEINGRLEDGRLVIDTLDYGKGNVQSRVDVPVSRPRKHVEERVVVTPKINKTFTQETRVETGVRTHKTQEHKSRVRVDSGWSHFDALVADCEKYGRTSWFARAETATPACKK